MARIKSAWEIALDKTRDIELDTGRLHSQELEKSGMALAGRYLGNMEMPREELVNQIEEVPESDRNDFLKGLSNVVVSNLVLPSDGTFAMRFDRLAELAGVLDGEAGAMMEKLKGFLMNYLEERENYIADIQEQLQTAMRQNPSQVDPSKFSQIIEQNLKRLDAQYQETLDSTKQTLKTLLH